MAITQAEFALQMLAQLRQLDPSFSAEIGTPERKIVDTVAQALADAQVDLNVLSGALDLDSKFGADLDRFLALFGFSRQQGVRATGIIRFSRSSTSLEDIVIPAGTQVLAPTDFFDGKGEVFFLTTTVATLAAGELSVDVPIRALLSGEAGNVAANTITTFAGTIRVFGITDITNPIPTTGGLSAEPDDELKIRFKNTVFRNLAGTQDQFLALAVSTAFTTKANVVGPISKFRELVQVPPVDDASAYDIDDDDVTETGNGASAEYSTALSANPYAKHIYTETDAFVTNNETGVLTTFYRPLIDFRLNVKDSNYDTSTNTGDAFRLATADLDTDPLSVDSNYRPNVTFLRVYNGDLTTISAVRPNDILALEYNYLSTASRNDVTRNVLNAVDVFIDGGNEVYADTVVPTPGSNPSSKFLDSPSSAYYWGHYRRFGNSEVPPVLGSFYIPLYNQPVLDVPDSLTVTGRAVWTRPVPGVNEVQQIIVTATTGTWTITYDGQGPTSALNWNASASDVQAALVALSNIGTNDITVTGGPGDGTGSQPYVISFKGALASANLTQMTTSAAGLSGGTAAVSTLVSGAAATTENKDETITTTYFRNQHYYLVQDVSTIGGTVRARDGLEWSVTTRGYISADDEEGTPSGPYITEYTTSNTEGLIEIDNYVYDKNIIDLQAALEGSKQITTDVLAHRAKIRYFKLDLTIMYNPGTSNKTGTNLNIQSSLQALFARQFFGQTVQLSDLLQAVHNVPDVDNVRWSSDIPGNADLARVIECKSDGQPLFSVFTDVVTQGTASVKEKQRIIFGGGAQIGTFVTLGYGSNTVTFTWDGTTSQIVTQLTAISGWPGGTPTVTGSGTPEDPYDVEFGANGDRSLIYGSLAFDDDNLDTKPDSYFAADILLADNELAALPDEAYDEDALAGLVIRSRAQNTFVRGGIGPGGIGIG